MKRVWLILAVACTVVSTGGCNRPSESDCRKAINNIRRIYDADPATDHEINAAIRSCQGNATKSSVQCFIDSNSMDELRNCEGDMFKQLFGSEPPPVEKLDHDKPAPEATKPAPPATPPTPAPAATGDGGASAPPADAGAATAPAPTTPPATAPSGESDTEKPAGSAP